MPPSVIRHLLHESALLEGQNGNCLVCDDHCAPKISVKPERIRGEIVSLDGDTLKVVHRRSGETISIEVKPEVVSAVKAKCSRTWI
jgi:hypothetical protein